MKQPSMKVVQRVGKAVDDNALDGEVRYQVVETTNTIIHRIGKVLTSAQVADLISIGIDVRVVPYKG